VNETSLEVWGGHRVAAEAESLGGVSEPRVLHLNTESTWRGGEQQVLYLIDGLARREVFSLLVAQPGGAMAERASAHGHTVVEQRMRAEADVPAILALRRLIRRERVSIVHCHTSHAHTLGAVAAALSGGTRRPKVVVSRRVDFRTFRPSVFGLKQIKYLHGVDRYVAVSHAVRDVLIGDGIQPERIVTVHSGIDVARIADEPDRTASLRGELSVPEGDKLVGTVAHLADHKGHRYLLEAVPQILTAHPRSTRWSRARWPSTAACWLRPTGEPVRRLDPGDRTLLRLGAGAGPAGRAAPHALPRAGSPLFGG